MKAVVSVFFLTIFLGCGFKKDKNIKSETAGGWYPMDSTLFENPCTKEVVAAITYRGTLSYKINDMAGAEKKMRQMLETAHMGDLRVRNEQVQNGTLYKRYEYNIPTESFPGLEGKLDSLLGMPMNKEISKNEISNKQLLEDLKEEQQTYKIYLDRYNNSHTSFQEKNELLPLIKNSAHSIKVAQQSICQWESKSALTIQFSAK